jgi:lysophospholipase L1-like esterase
MQTDEFDMNRKHLVLLGDSIFDNAAYVPAGLAVIQQLQDIIPPNWKASLLAKDGDVTADLERQIPQIPADATHLFISVGGNDALQALNTFSLPAERVSDALNILGEIRQAFQRDYRSVLWQALAFNLPVVVCTIYDAVPNLSVEARTALSLFNDTITREASCTGVSVIDLRHVCTEASDYSALSPIEPSECGGLKIARCIVGRVA